jgi:Uma2 family endonuclease
VIGGELLALPSPSWVHEKLSVRLAILILDYLTRHGLGDDVFTAPLNVLLSAHDVVQPDLVYAGPDRRATLHDRRFVDGAPDLLVEIFPASTRHRDQGAKLALYARAGVPEVWRVDPEAATVTVLAPTGGAYRPVPADEHGMASSAVLPGLGIDVRALVAGLG